MVRKSLVSIVPALLLLLLGASCDAPGDDRLDAEDAPFAVGKADGQLDPDSDQAKAVLALVNDPGVDFPELDDDARLHRTAARNIIEHRDGADELPGTPDDDLFDDLRELDDIRFVGPFALSQLLEYAIAQGYLEQVQGGSDEAMTDVVFSPQQGDDTHNARVAELIGQAEHSIDIAMYSFSNAGIADALEEAAARGVQIRFIYETASEDRKLEGEEMLDSRSGRLEEDGIDVRWVNKIMHHKFMIVDGPRSDLSRAASAVIATGSANWSNSAATRYDENTLFLQGHEEIALRLQQEFNLLWEHSRPFEANPDLGFVHSEIDIADADIVDSPDSHVWFTSDNFDIHGDTTFTKTGRNTVSDQIIAAIEDADESIWIASGHLRHRGISEALMAKAQAEPDLDVRVYLDAQEYVSEFTHQLQLEDLEDCLDEATTDTQIRNCMDKGFRFGFQVEQHGVDVRYKWYSYRWHYTYAAQMHHKYVIIDSDELWTGSYNLSDNAEHNTFENMLHFTGPQYQPLVDGFEANFAQIWNTGREQNLLADLSEEIATADVIPLVFDSMALEWEEVDALKDLIQDNCDQVDSPDFRQHPEDHLICER